MFRRLFSRNYKKEAMTFLSQHSVGQRIFSIGDGGAKMQYLRDCGHVTSDRVSDTRWVHTIVSKSRN